MKIIFSLLTCLLLTLSHAQAFKTITLLPPESQEHTDLSFLKDELQGKQLVMLGELTHMYGNIFEMKARVIEYLHQEMGFTTIAMESSMYDIWKMNQDGFDPKVFNNAIWGVWAGSLEFQRLVNYIDKNKLNVIGFDSQINNTSAFIEDFYDYCENQHIKLKLDEDDMGILMEGVLDNLTVEEEDIDFYSYEKELQRIIKEIEKLEPKETNYYWKQLTKSLLALSQDAYFNKEEILTTNFGNKNHNIRDKQMADNLLSYIHRNPEKIIVWADNIHVINDNSSIKKPIANEFISMGTYLKKELKEKAYSLATIHANDSIYDRGTKRWESTPVKSGSFESELDQLNIPYLFVSSNQEAMHSTKETRLLDFIDFTEARLDQLHDGYIFFQQATLPKRETETVNVVEKELESVKKIEQIAIGQNIILKGQVLDKKTNTPVPFATLILKNEEIYRVADEDGFFELPVKKAMIQTAAVALSSMGFEPKTILLKELTEKIYLTPKFEDLAEVVVSGFLSPQTVLKKAVLGKKDNHPTEPFNFYRYGKVIINVNDTTKLDLELITKDSDEGYLSPYVISQRVEQIKWNKNNNPKAYQNSAQFFSYRQNAIRYANILHKRKYKKFKLNFVKSIKPEDEGLYIIAFQTERNKWNYTNRSYPTTYSGRVYIDREKFAIVKVVENWETTLNQEEITKYYTSYDSYKNVIQTTIKEENVCTYEDIANNGKYFATEYYNSFYQEFLGNENQEQHLVKIRDSKLYDFELNDFEEIEYYQYNNKKENSLYRVEYDENFWDSFYKRKIEITQE